MRKVYVEYEASDIGKALSELESRGYGRDKVIVIDTEDPVSDAVLGVTGIDIGVLASGRSTRDVVMARTIYIRHRIDMGYTLHELSAVLNKPKSAVRWYLRHYEESMQGDHVFREHERRCLEARKADSRFGVPQKGYIQKGKLKLRSRLSGIRKLRRKPERKEDNGQLTLDL